MQLTITTISEDTQILSCLKVWTCWQVIRHVVDMAGVRTVDWRFFWMKNDIHEFLPYLNKLISNVSSILHNLRFVYSASFTLSPVCNPAWGVPLLEQLLHRTSWSLLSVGLAMSSMKLPMVLCVLHVRQVMNCHHSGAARCTELFNILLHATELHPGQSESVFWRGVGAVFHTA